MVGAGPDNVADGASSSSSITMASRFGSRGTVDAKSDEVEFGATDETNGPVSVVSLTSPFIGNDDSGIMFFDVSGTDKAESPTPVAPATTAGAGRAALA